MSLSQGLRVRTLSDPLVDWIHRAAVHTLLFVSFALVQVAPPTATGSSPTLLGRVVDASGTPVEGARVLAGESSEATVFYSDPPSAVAMVPGLVREPDERPHAAGDTLTDRSGRFRLERMKPGVYGLLAVKEGVGLAFCLEFRPEAGECHLELAPPRSLMVRITGIDWDPSRNLLTVEPTRFTGNLKIRPSVHSGPPGSGVSFELRDLPPIDSWQVRATEWVLDGGYHATLVQARVEIESAARLKLDLEAGAVLEGTVQGPDGAPLAAVSVVAIQDGEALQLGTVTDADGRFRIAGLTAGEEYGLEISRHALRATAGCGFGPRDVLQTARARVPDPGGPIVLRLAALRDVLGAGATAPDFRATQLDGEELGLSELRGKVVLLDFWATWCVLCRQELPNLLEFQRTLAAGGELVIVGVSVDEDADAARRFVDSRGIGWPQIAQGLATRGPIATLYNVCSTPTSFVIGRDGRIRARDLFGADLRAELERALSAR